MEYSQVFQPLFEALDFSPKSTFREGPRFYVVGGEYQKDKVIFKADVEPLELENRRARLKLRREAAFLESGSLEHMPGFYTKGEHRGFFWLLEEWVPGESQEVNDSTFLFKDSFFTQKNLDQCVEFLLILRDLPKGETSPEFKEFIERFAKRYTLKDYMGLIASDKKSLVGKETMDKIDEVISKKHRIFNSSQNVIAHHEFYAPHIFVNGGELNVIDWENVGWGNPAYDFTELWFRSFSHPDFQKELLAKFRSAQGDKGLFDELFRIEVLLQGLGNIKYFNVTDLPEEKEVADKVINFVEKEIEKALP